MIDTRPELEILCPKLSGESAAAYSAFIDFALSGLSLPELLSKYLQPSPTGVPTKKYETLRTWSGRFKWAERRHKWRSYCLKIREEKLLKEYDEYRNKMIENAKSLTEKAEAMLKHPLVEQKVKRSTNVNGTDVPTEVIIKPARWSAGTAADYLETATELMKQAVGDEAWAIEYLSRLGYTILRDEEETTAEDGE